MLRKVALGLVLGLALATPARADVFDDNPSATALGPGNVYVFVRAADGTIVMRHLSAGAWSDWAPLPGLNAGSGPGAAAYTNTVQVFARGPNGVPYQASISAGAVSNWAALDGTINSAPAAAARHGTPLLDIAALGATDTEYVKTYTPGAPAPWAAWVLPFGASTYTSAPTTVSWSANRRDVFTRGSNGAVWQMFSDAGGQWQFNAAVPNNADVVLGAPTSATMADGQFDLFARFPDNTLRRLHYSQSGWGFWTKVDNDTSMTSSPAATSDQNGSEYVFARTGDTVSYRTLSGSTWSGWTSLGVPAVPVVTPPPVVVTPIVAPVTPAGTPVVQPERLGTIKPLLGFNFKSGMKSTQLTSLVIKSFPKGSTVTVTCKKGCSAKSLTKRNAKSPLSLKAFVRKPLKVGTVITVVVSRAGSISSVKILTVRARKAPAVKTLCQAPGAKKPRAC